MTDQAGSDREELEALAAACDFGLLIVGAGGEIEFASRTLRDMLSTTQAREGAAGLSKWQARLGAALERLQSSDESCLSVNFAGLFEQSPLSDYQLELRAIDAPGRPRFLGLLRDRNGLEALDSDLRTATRFRSLSTLYVGATHDLRGPLNNIVITLELLKLSVRKNRDQSATDSTVAREGQYFDTVEEEIQRLNRELQALLALTESAPEEAPGALDMVQELNEILKLIKAQARLQCVDIDWSAPERPVSVHCYRSRVRQGLLNIAINALEAMPEGGNLSLRLQQLPDKVVIDICDTGQGIPATLRARVFERHFTTKNTGTGIGLYVARRVIEDHGGTLQVAGEGGSGACLRVTLPSISRSKQGR